MVDFFLLVMIAGAGDELQGIKKGVIEIADALLVNKADGTNKPKAEMARNEYSMALKYLAPATLGWETLAHTCSALLGNGVPEIWNVIKTFEEKTRKTGVFEERRKNQSLEWVLAMIENYLKESFYNNPDVHKNYPQVKENILNGAMLPTTAAEELLKTYFQSKS